MRYIKCPVDDCPNYMDNKQALCDVCTAKKNGSTSGSKTMDGTVAKFVLKRGVSPESKSDIRELKVFKDAIHILAFDKDGRCVGVIFSHDEKGEKAHEKAEIAFFSRYHKEYGQWHRVRSDWDEKELLSFVKLQDYLDEYGEYEYTAYLNFVRKGK